MPYMPDKREYRNFTVDAFKPTEQEGEERSYIVEGYATTFDAPYDFVGDMKECISSRALDGADMTDVIFQFDHEGTPLARIRNNTLAIMPDDHGLFVRADLGGSEKGRQLYEAISNGLVDRMSWGFTIADEGWEYDPETRTSTISKVDKVYDVSAVSLPANEDTEIKARSYLDGVIEAEQRESLQRSKDAELERRKRLALYMEITNR